ncbi:MAG: sulfatase-like hydrolase/transferase [Planctomycetes bacterium]|nr:sulfatase-like hydrolase/transferase [Planctomycetota bacterium]
MSKPNVLFVMTDQQRFDTIAALGNAHIYTPNMDRLVRRGVTFTNAYTTTPVCVAARYTIRTGCDALTTRATCNQISPPLPGQAETMEGRCGPYLARTMRALEYRTFGIGKFHSHPTFEDLGYDVHLHSEELYGKGERERDAYASWIAKEHPHFDFVETLMGERTEMYYMPQMSPLPAHLGVEAWAAARAVEQLAVKDERPYFGFVSFVGPHPPLAPPIPFNRMYDPDRMPSPIRGDLRVDHMDGFIPYMNQAIWAEDVDDLRARCCKARYYGEISYIDQCLGHVLDAVERRPDADNTVICFFADHGDHLGDHHAWQKESFFEASAHIPFLVSWPAKLPKDAKRDDLVCLTDLFAIATGAAGKLETREGHDVLGVLENRTAPRETLFGFYGPPGDRRFKIMVRQGEWKYIYFANGGMEQLFNVAQDPHELTLRNDDAPDVVKRLRAKAVERLSKPDGAGTLDGGDLLALPHGPVRERKRVLQFDGSRRVLGFPERPQDVLKDWKLRLPE